MTDDDISHKTVAPMLTAGDVAQRLSVSTETVLRWIRSGDLPAVYLSSRAVRVGEDELADWLAARRTSAP